MIYLSNSGSASKSMSPKTIPPYVIGITTLIVENNYITSVAKGADSTLYQVIASLVLEIF